MRRITFVVIFRVIEYVALSVDDSPSSVMAPPVPKVALLIPCPTNELIMSVVDDELVAEGN